MRKITVYYDDVKQEVEIKDDKLIVPNGIKRVSCDNNQLKELVLPDGVKYVSCDCAIVLNNQEKFTQEFNNRFCK